RTAVIHQCAFLILQHYSSLYTSRDETSNLSC
uniref:Uncharacterized protein n=1 Tax=Anopheles atroparvus TaxID=41427 RepID=A0AAG5D1Q1_ANOAO